MNAWQYLIVALPTFGEASSVRGESASVEMLNTHGGEGWEAVGMAALDDGSVAVLLKRPSRPDHEASRGRPSRPG